jgi:N-acetylglutamate synthase/N-acetylornithine aminotransferase
VPVNAELGLRTASGSPVKVALGLGKGRDRVLTCDLIKEYVAINGDYRS